MHEAIDQQVIQLHKQPEAGYRTDRAEMATTNVLLQEIAF